MRCDSCGSEIERSWKFCPRCGSQAGGFFSFNFGDIFSRMRKEMEGMTRDAERMERDIEAFDLSPFFRKPLKPMGSGFSIKIVSGTGIEPRVEVKTFGVVDQEKIQKQVEQMGYKSRLKEKVPAGGVREGKERQEKSIFPAPKITEEPVTEVKRIDSRVVVEMALPGVNSEEDIDITELESSVEVKAIAGDKAYFKILTKPEEFNLVQKRFEKGKLYLEFA